MTKQKEFNKAIVLRDITKIKLLLKDKDVDPSINNNNAIFIS